MNKMIDIPKIPSLTSCIHQGDALSVLKGLDSGSVHCCVTSPPYWGLRDYKTEPVHFAAGDYSPMPGLPAVEYPEWTGQLGLEPDPWMYAGHMVEIFREIRRVLRGDGTLWLNMGNSYATQPYADSHTFDPKYGGRNRKNGYPNKRKQTGLKHKDLVGISWMVAFSLQADSWYLRQDIIWSKPNPMPESVTDRCTKSHEYIFLLSKSEQYYYDHEAIREKCKGDNPRNIDSIYQAPGQPEHTFLRKAGLHKKQKYPSGWDSDKGPHGTIHRQSRSDPKYSNVDIGEKRNKRSVWTVATFGFPGAHFATFPPKLIEPCIKAGCPEGGTVLDPFAGSGTTGEVAARFGCRFIGIELNLEYINLAEKRLNKAQRSLF